MRNPFRRHEIDMPERKPGGILKRAFERAIEDSYERGLPKRLRRRGNERGLTVVHHTPADLGDVPLPRPYAGKKSKRTHARRWGA
jgi:hypothetical protein